MTGKCNGFGILTQVWCSIKLFKCSVKVGGSSKGRTSDSGSDCEGSNPSPPAIFFAFAESLLPNSISCIRVTQPADVESRSEHE